MGVTKFPNGVATDYDGCLTATIADLSTGASSWSNTLPFNAEIVGAEVTMSGAITVAAAAVTFEIGGTAITDMVATVAVAGSGAGVVTAAVAPTAEYSLTAGTSVEVITDGGSTDASVGIVSIFYKRV